MRRVGFRDCIHLRRTWLRIFADKLKQLREKAELSQQNLASRAGLSSTIVYELETRKVADVRLGTVIALAGALNVRISDLIDVK
jgi:transcriptional regulator with XRE-family HTH domain